MKEQYIKQVSKLLAVPHKQKKDILRDLEEAFASAKEHGETEEQVLERLGTPEEFAAGISELNTVVKKRMKPKTIAAILCAVVLVAVMGALSAAYVPMLFKFGNPMPYLKAAKLLDEDNHFAVVENKDGLVLITTHECYNDRCHDVLVYMRETYGVVFDMQIDGTVVFAHGKGGSIKCVVETDSFLDEYTVWNVPTDITELPPNHELIDFIDWGTGGVSPFIGMTLEEVHELIGEPSEVTEEGTEIYYNCSGNRVEIFVFDDYIIALTD